MNRNMVVHAAQLLTILLCCFLLFPLQINAEDDDRAQRAHTVTLYLENDALGFDHSDRYYTHGTKLSWISQDLSDYRDNPLIPEWSHPVINVLPFVKDQGYQHSVSISLGQNIYTPEDKQRSDLIKDDRPYAGITYLAFGFHSKDSSLMNTLELDVGMVGRHSYAEDCQKEVHKWIHSTDPKGWKHQLKDEPIVNIFLERKWRFLPMEFGSGLGFDCIPHLGCGIGNAFTGANAGGQIRFGWNLPRDFGTFLIRPGSDSNAPVESDDPRFFQPLHRLGVHVFLAVDGVAVARNIMLDGNTFRDSHSVDKKHFVASFIGGMGIILHRFKITYSYVYQTKEFKTQRDDQKYASITLSYSF